MWVADREKGLFSKYLPRRRTSLASVSCARQTHSQAADGKRR